MTPPATFPVPVRLKLHGTLLRLIYRFIAPGHPRGWVNFFHSPESGADDSKVRVFCRGMERWNLPNLEMADVPYDLRGYAHGIMFDILGYLKAEKVIRAGERMGGKFVAENQSVFHVCRFIDADAGTPPAPATLRVVDDEPEGANRFPAALVSAHLFALAEQEKNPSKAQVLLRRSIAINPGADHVGPDVEAKGGENPGNYFSWYHLGDLLCAEGKFEEGLAHLATAVRRWPSGARQFAAHVVREIESGNLPPADADPRSKFWSSVHRG